MEQGIDHNALNDVLKRCGATWDAAQTHGLLSGRLAVAGANSGFDWLAQILEGTDPDDALRTECEEVLGALFEATYRQLAERLSGFEPVLPDDEESTATRATALAQWCEGFLHGLVCADHGAELKHRLGTEPLADIIRDMLQITRASAEDDTAIESDEAAYVELVEYVRVATQLAYEELSEIRHAANEDVAGAVH